MVTFLTQLPQCMPLIDITVIGFGDFITPIFQYKICTVNFTPFVPGIALGISFRNQLRLRVYQINNIVHSHNLLL
jgi:hypothetical protein